MSHGKITGQVIERLSKIVGDENVLTLPHHRFIRAASAAPFPLHKWEAHAPDVVVLPGSTEETAEVVKLANEYKIPIVPRAGGTGLADGAVPLKHGIVLDIKRMNKILEIDEENMCVTVQTGINNQVLNLELNKYGYWWPFDIASFPCSCIGGNLGTNAWSLIPGVSGHIRDLVRSMVVVLPTGKIMRVGEGGGRKISKSSVGYQLKYLFIGHQGTLGIITEATLEMFPKPEVEFPAFFAYRSFMDAWKNALKMAKSGLRTMGTHIIFDEQKVEALRRDDEAYIPQPEWVKSIIATCFYGTEAEVRGAAEKIFEIAAKDGGVYLGVELSEGDWASRHDRYHIPYHGRHLDGQVGTYSWHCEDAAVNYSALPYVVKKWHELVAEYKKKYDIFDDMGGFYYNNNPFKQWGDYLSEIDIFIDEYHLTEELWQKWLELKRKIAEVVLEVGGSISSAHGGTRPGDVELVVSKELDPNAYEIMKNIKKMLDPNNIMNPGKYLLDSAYIE
ncbi:MAG: FAD-binding oxidoreductase [Candidatus Bathyarchaeia archaeon]